MVILADVAQDVMEADDMTLSLDHSIERCAVLGAAGKMGRGIAFLLLQEMALAEAARFGTVGSGAYVLTLLDTDWQTLLELKKSLRGQLLKVAEKNIISLRSYLAKNQALISNSDIIDYFINGSSDIVNISIVLESAKDARLVFEAVVEDVVLKSSLLGKLASISSREQQEQYFFSNTSSIPIAVLNQEAKLAERIIGFHFYNPPAVQKLVEIIPMAGGEHNLYEFACQLAGKLKKIVVTAHDVAGFIGNGHFMREILFACELVHEIIASSHTAMEAVYIINKMTQQWLLRPMGIFQLVDYVGLDVMSRVAQIMSNYLPQPIILPDLIASLLNTGKKGGQESDGAQKEGFFQYSYHKLKGIYEWERQGYCPLDELPWQHKCDELLGSAPPPEFSWKNLHGKPDCQAKVDDYIAWLEQASGWGAQLARRFMTRSIAIAEQLVSDQVSDSLRDVDIVLKNGFYHLYGPSEVSKKLSGSELGHPFKNTCKG